MVIGVGSVLIVGCDVLLVSWSLWLFYDVGVWLVNWWYGYVGILDRLFFIKRVTRSITAPVVEEPLPRTIALLIEAHGVIVPLKSWSNRLLKAKRGYCHLSILNTSSDRH